MFVERRALVVWDSPLVAGRLVGRDRKMEVVRQVGSPRRGRSTLALWGEAGIGKGHGLGAAVAESDSTRRRGAP